MSHLPTQSNSRLRGLQDLAHQVLAHDSDTFEVSVVAPLYNEADSLIELTRRICEALEGLSFEIILVDDGSRDDSWQIVKLLCGEQPQRVRGLRHRRNFGKADALATGFAEARGRIIVTLDADLQDDPSEIPAMVAKLYEGFDLVSGWKRDRNDPISKTLPSRFFNAAARRVSGLPLHDFNCGLKAYRREVIEQVPMYGELHRFIPILAHAEGFRVTELPVRHFARQHGESKYGWNRLFKGGIDLATVVLLTRYLNRPGHFFGAFGLAVGTIGVSILGYLSTMKIALGQDIGTRPMFFLGILATLFGAQLISTGFIGEFVLRHKGHGQSNPRVSQSSSHSGK